MTVVKAEWIRALVELTDQVQIPLPRLAMYERCTAGECALLLRSHFVQ